MQPFNEEPMEKSNKKWLVLARRGMLKTVGAAGVALPLGAGLTSAQEQNRKQWSFSTDAVVHSSPTIVDQTVFFGSRDEKLYAIDSTDGTEVWAFSTDGPVVSSPAVVDGTVYVGSRDENLYAVDANDGTEVWSFETDGPIVSSPTAIDGTVFFGSDDGNVYALDAADGTEIWRVETGDNVFSSPTVVDGTVFVGNRAVEAVEESLYALDASDGSEKWTFNTGANVRSSPTVVDGTLYVGSNDGNVYALATDDGSEQWTFQTDDSVQSSPTVFDGTVFVGSHDHSVYAVDADTGSEIWSFETDDMVRSSPTVADGTVFVGSYDQHVYGLDANDGTEVWTFETGDYILSDPTVVDGTVVVGSNDENVYALHGDVDGSSEGSRVELGTLGHHHVWANTAGTQPTEPVEIEDWHDLTSIRESLNREYVLTADLDAETPGYTDHVGNPQRGFEPIGDTDNPFTGTFDGNGHTISDLEIDRPDEEAVGLFSDSDGATFTDIVLSDIDIAGEFIVGGLVGAHLASTVTNVAVSGNVEGEERVGGVVGLNVPSEGEVENGVAAEVRDTTFTGVVTGKRPVGGLIGDNRGTVADCSATGSVTGAEFVGGLIGLQQRFMATVTRSFAKTTLSLAVPDSSESYDPIIGGLIGGQRNSNEVTTSFAETAIDATKVTNDTAEVGGFVGLLGDQGTINHSYARGSIDAEDTSSLGGFAGTNQGTIEESYAATNILGTGSDVGGFVGRLEGSVNDSYWDTEVSGQNESPAADGLSTGAMTGDSAVDTMDGFAFTDVWQPVIAETDINGTTPTADSYPILADIDPELQLDTQETIEIEDWHDLDTIRDELSADYLLVADLDEQTAGYDDVASETANDGSGFDPIGSSSDPFIGTFDGNDQTITGLHIEDNGDRIGLFGMAEDSLITNLRVEDVEINGTGLWVGGLVGKHKGTIENVHITGHVAGDEFIGGLAGSNDEGGTIVQSSAKSSITAIRVAGGLVGVNFESSTISESYAAGDVTATGEDDGLDGDQVGGLVGENGFESTIDNSYAISDVEGQLSVGGLAGENGPESSITTSYATGAVEGEENVGGLVGLSDDFSDSYWDTQTSGQNESAGGEGLSTDEMTGESASQTMSPFDFTGIWKSVSIDGPLGTDTDGYPILRNLEQDTQLERQGVTTGVDGVSVEIVHPDDGQEVTEDEALTVDVAVTNTAESETDATINLTSPIQDTIELPVSGETTDTVSFEIPGSEINGEVEITVTSQDDTAQLTVTAVDPCFIATAAYNTPKADEIDVLRAFRDDILQQHALGRVFTRLYYRTSPPIARWIRLHPRRRRLVREYVVSPMVKITNKLNSTD